MADLNEGCGDRMDAPEKAPSRRGNPNPCPVVAVGASAGGLEAFQELFQALPAEPGSAFVLIQHLAPRHETLIPELLAPHTAMPVRQVVDETVIQANHVYVAPPSATLTIDNCVLYVTRPPRTSRSSLIDRFFRSLAEDQEDDAIGVILSGTGTDGALGVRTIKERGGLTVAQAPETARHDSMPRSAILTGMVDYVLPLDQIPVRLLEHLTQLREGTRGTQARFREEVEGYLGKICAILRRSTGHDFRHYKESTLVRRVRRRLDESRVGSVEAYVELLGRDPGEVEQLFQNLLIGVTHFFRDAEVFQALSERIVPRLFEGKDADARVRIWVPGCATGEEAYSIAILLRERMEEMEVPPQVQVFATDIDAQALDAARQAWYPESIASQVAPERLRRYFVQHGNMYQICREVREMCLFSTHNLITDPPFSRLDLISCRNLMIYLEGELQRKILDLFHFALRPGGFLLLGPSETVAGKTELFRTLDKKNRLYQSRDTVRPPISFPLVERGRLVYRPAEEPRRSHNRQQEVARVFESVLLENFAPACVVVNEVGDAVYFSPRTGRYLEPPAGVPSVSVLDMARKGLRLDLRTALHKAVTARVMVTHEDVAFELEGQTHRVNVVVRPMPELGDDPGLFMVVFQEVQGPGEALPEGVVLTRDDAAFRKLEAELRSTKDHLQATLEELESSNEELVSSNEELLSMNEELQSANEELQTSKEELQSVNEELESVNSELRKKVEELNRANSDLQNLFQSTRIATVFVDRELRIKNFTPAATEVFRLIEGDVGRPLADLAPRFAGVDLAGDGHEVLRTLAPMERQVRREDGSAWYLLRVLPYRTVEDVIDGVVITLLDITELKRAEEALRRSEGRLRRLVDSGVIGVVTADGAGRISEANEAFLSLVGYTREDLRAGRVDWKEMTPPEHLPRDEAGLAEARARGACNPYEKEYLCKDGSRVPILLGFAALDEDGQGEGGRYICFVLDLTARKRLEDELRRRTEQLLEADRRKDEFLAMLGHELRNPLAPIRNCLHILRSPGVTGEQQGKALRTVDRQVVHLTRLVDDLLDVARISRGKILLRRQRLDLVETVRAMVEDQRTELEAAGIEVVLDVPGLPVWIEGDPTRLSQAAGNVLHNAGKFTDRGGRVNVSVWEEPERDSVAVTVRDTGVGMAPELLPWIFEPFHQADRGPDGGRGGLGLGLALVKGLTLLHGGSVEAFSAGPGLGSEITIRLPLATGTEETPMADESHQKKPERSRRCLVIEDHVDAAESLALLLKLIGHETEVAFDADQGLEAARRFRPDVVLCDIGLPGSMDGYATARAVRADPELRDIFLIALTGYGQEEDRRKALEAGFDAHLTKPADIDALRRLLAEAG